MKEVHDTLAVKSDGSLVATYKYGPRGRRVEKDVSGDVKRFIYSGYRLLAVYDGDDQWLQNFVHGFGLDEVEMLEQRDILDYDGDGNTSEVTRNFYHRNALGSVVAITDMNGQAAVDYRYDPYGKATATRDGEPVSSDPLGQSWSYSGRFYDRETGLYHYRARYYDPSLGRFLQRDPLGYAPGPNLFEYGKSSPVSNRDPLGLQEEKKLDQMELCYQKYLKLAKALMDPVNKELREALNEWAKAQDAYKNYETDDMGRIMISGASALSGGLGFILVNSWLIGDQLDKRSKEASALKAAEKKANAAKKKWMDMCNRLKKLHAQIMEECSKLQEQDSDGGDDETPDSGGDAGDDGGSGDGGGDEDDGGEDDEGGGGEDGTDDSGGNCDGAGVHYAGEHSLGCAIGGSLSPVRVVSVDLPGSGRHGGADGGPGFGDGGDGGGAEPGGEDDDDPPVKGKWPYYYEVMQQMYRPSFHVGP
jgi:RHS repeat-associated protein